MCVQCVANSVPYVGLAAGGLRIMAWRARSTRAVRSTPERTEAVEPDATPAPAGRT